MQLVLDREQRMIRDAATQFFSERGGPKRLRAVRDGKAGDAPDLWSDLWSDLAELGWVGALVPERFGGAGLGLAEMCLVCEAAGRALAPEPLVACAVLAPSALIAAGDDELATRRLPALVEGRARATMAWDERGMRGDVAATHCEVRHGSDGFVLHGQKRDVVAARSSDVLLVSARDTASGAIGLYLVDRGAAGVELAPQRRIDSLPVDQVTFSDVVVAHTDRIGDEALLRAALDRATVAASAELLGVASAAFDMTLGYLRERQQFGVPIGSFQVLRHRAARMYIALELARSAVMAAARTCDAQAAGAPIDAVTLGQAVSLAKARTNDAALLVGDESVQMHGGIGMTDEHDIGLYYKRARVLATTHGDSASHRDRWARLAGY